MPELPEVETVRRGLLPALEGAVVERVELRRPDLRFPFPPGFAERIEGRRVVSVGRRAKYLVVALDDGSTLVMHLGMSGAFRVENGPPIYDSDRRYYPAGKDAAHDHVVFRLGSGTHIIYNDPRRFGFMTLVEPNGLAQHPLFAGLGPEPTGNSFQAEALAAGLAGRSAPLKAALLDQRLIAGLGNIYVCEALWRAALSPKRAARTMVRASGTPTARLVRLVEAVREVIADAVEAGGSSLRDYVQADGSLGRFQHRFAVYDREGKPCLRALCGGTIRRIVQSGRSTFFCPRCQR